MMQCGMYVAAESFRATLYDGIFTHFRREEDSHMKSGKLDEELKRMSALVDQLTSRSMVLFNESFAATNPREAAEIGTQIVQALLETGMKVVYVTHLFDLSMRFYKLGSLPSLFLRAERLEDGSRTFRIREGEPLATSYGEDLYRRLFQLPSKTAPPSLDG
jgi:DNA mismatch repair ATPase MutS